ncbi:MAG: glycosyltransferase family 2 protein [Floccifex sp.]
MNKPFVSVIIPTFKRSDSLCRAIDIVLNQTYKNVEIIVVDDNGIGTQCQIDTEMILQKYIQSKEIKYIKHDVNKNGSAARNTGLSLCIGDFVNFLDDDDVFLASKIECQVEILQTMPMEFGATYCNTRIVRHRKLSSTPLYKNTKFKKDGNLVIQYLCQEITFNTSSILFRKSVLEELGGFDESFVRHQDYEIMTRFFMKYQICCTGEEPLLVYDLTVDRKNMPNVQKSILIEEKFLSTFSEYFNSIPCGNLVGKHLWMNCLFLALQSKDYKYNKQILKAIKRYGSLNLKDIYLIIKNYFIGIIK